jgi:hypothetical protein
MLHKSTATGAPTPTPLNKSLGQNPRPSAREKTKSNAGPASNDPNHPDNSHQKGGKKPKEGSGNLSNSPYAAPSTTGKPPTAASTEKARATCDHPTAMALAVARLFTKTTLNGRRSSTAGHGDSETDADPSVTGDRYDPTGTAAHAARPATARPQRPVTPATGANHEPLGMDLDGHEETQPREEPWQAARRGKSTGKTAKPAGATRTTASTGSSAAPDRHGARHAEQVNTTVEYNSKHLLTPSGSDNDNRNIVLFNVPTTTGDARQELNPNDFLAHIVRESNIQELPSDTSLPWMKKPLWNNPRKATLLVTLPTATLAKQLYEWLRNTEKGGHVLNHYGMRKKNVREDRGYKNNSTESIRTMYAHNAFGHNQSKLETFVNTVYPTIMGIITDTFATAPQENITGTQQLNMEAAIAVAIYDATKELKLTYQVPPAPKHHHVPTANGVPDAAADRSTVPPPPQTSRLPTTSSLPKSTPAQPEPPTTPQRQPEPTAALDQTGIPPASTGDKQQPQGGGTATATATVAAATRTVTPATASETAKKAPQVQTTPAQPTDPVAQADSIPATTTVTADSDLPPRTPAGQRNTRHHVEPAATGEDEKTDTDGPGHEVGSTRKMPRRENPVPIPYDSTPAERFADRARLPSPEKVQLVIPGPGIEIPKVTAEPDATPSRTQAKRTPARHGS